MLGLVWVVSMNFQSVGTFFPFSTYLQAPPSVLYIVSMQRRESNIEHHHHVCFEGGTIERGNPWKRIKIKGSLVKVMATIGSQVWFVYLETEQVDEMSQDLPIFTLILSLTQKIAEKMHDSSSPFCCSALF